MITSKTLLTYFLSALPAFGIDVDINNLDTAEVHCLAKNIYYESRGESLKGQYAVANTTLNRVSQPHYPNSVCEVVKFKAASRSTGKLICAFSWYCEPGRKKHEIEFKKPDGSLDQVSLEQFQIAVVVAVTAMNGLVEDVTKGATHFHNPRISFPSWRHMLKPTSKIGNHDFYKRYDE